MIGSGRKLTGRQKLDAYDQQQELFYAAGDRCVVCGSFLRSGTPQLAHRFGQGKSMLDKYGPAIVHHPLAVVPTERVEPCNSAVMIGDETAPGRALIARIRRVLSGEEPKPNMREEYQALREEFERGET